MDSLNEQPPDFKTLRHSRGEPIHFNGRRIGRALPAQGVAVFRVQWRRNFFRRMASWTLDRDIVRDLSRQGLKWVVFDDTEFSQTWAARVSDFLTLAQSTQNRTGVKAALHRQHWTLLAEEPRPEVRVPQQPEFFNLGASLGCGA